MGDDTVTWTIDPRCGMDRRMVVPPEPDLAHRHEERVREPTRGGGDLGWRFPATAPTVTLSIDGLDGETLGDARDGLVVSRGSSASVRVRPETVRVGEVELEGVTVESRCRREVREAGTEHPRSTQSDHGQDRTEEG